MADAGDLFATCEELLAAAAEALDTVPDQLGTDLLGAPERQLIMYGAPIHDCCEQLVVWVNPVGAGARSPNVMAPDFQVVRPTFRVHATRCAPKEALGAIVNKRYVVPEAEAITEFTRQVHADGWALWNHIFNLVNADLLFTKCGDMVQWGMTSITPMGGCGGWELQFTVQLDGYQEELTT